MQVFLFLLPRSCYSCFSCQEVQKVSWIPFHDLEKSCKILRALPRIIPKILARNVKNPRNFLARKPRRQALGNVPSTVVTQPLVDGLSRTIKQSSWAVLFLRVCSGCSLARKKNENCAVHGRFLEKKIRRTKSRGRTNWTVRKLKIVRHTEKQCARKNEH